MKTVLLIFTVAVGIARLAQAGQPEDSYPDKPLGVNEVKIASLTDWKEKLQQYTGKTVVLPASISDVVTKYPAIDALVGGSIKAGGTQSNSLHGFLSASSMFTGLKWHYDPAKSAFIVNFPWEVKDERSNAELSKVLLPAKPAPDAWQKAFEGLCGKPENQYITWMVRWVGTRSQGGLSNGEQVCNILTGNISDDAGQPHILICNAHPAWIRPSEDIVSYYLFDANGKIEEGGVVNLGAYPSARAFALKISLEDDKSCLLCREGRVDLVFVVQKSHLVLKEKIENGKSVDPKVTDSGFLGRVVLTVDAGGPHWNPPTPIDNSP